MLEYHPTNPQRAFWRDEGRKIKEKKKKKTKKRNSEANYPKTRGILIMLIFLSAFGETFTLHECELIKGTSRATT